MNPPDPPGEKVWSTPMTIASLVTLLATFLLGLKMAESFPKKELFCCWLVVFFNAYIGAFIAKQALKRGPNAFFAWAILINGLRVGFFLAVLVVILKFDFLDVRIFAAVTVLGYLILLAGEVARLHTQSLKAFTAARNLADRDE